MNRLNWAAGLLAAYSNAVQIDLMVADEEALTFGELQLQAHNAYRAEHSADPLLWDADLATAAQAWAETLEANDDGLVHSDTLYVGENLAYYSNSDEAVQTETLEGTSWATDQWYNEVTDPGYNFESPGLASNPGTGHFTQVVWASSSRMGCGVSGSFVVCQYEPAGNVLGNFAGNVLPNVNTVDEDDQDEADQADQDANEDGETGEGEGEAEEAENADEADAEDADDESECTGGNCVNIDISFDVNTGSGVPDHHHHAPSASQTAALEAIASAQAALDAANAELAEANAADEDDTAADEDATPAPVMSHVHVILNDSTEIDGTTWADLKATAMAEDFKTSDEYAAYSAENRAIIDAFIEAQDAAGEGNQLAGSLEVEVQFVDEPVPEVPVDPKFHSLLISPDDANIVYAFDATWEDYKDTAMQFGWDQDAVIKVLPNFERAVIEAHQQA